MHRRFALGLLIALGVIMAAGSSFAASWDSFKSAQLSGITLDKPLQVNVLDYTLTVGSNPTVSIGTKTYAVNWVQAFYVVSGTSNGSFTATQGKSPKGWSWDSKGNPGQIAGWTTQGNNRLKPGDSMKFSFAQFDPRGNPVLAGYHISYQDGNKAVTDWFKTGGGLETGAVPEASSIAGLGAALGGLLVFTRRRKAQRLS